MPEPASQVTPSAPLPMTTLLYLQKFAGNAAVAEMLGAATEKRGLPQQQEPLSPTAGSTAPQAAANGASPAAPAAAPAEAKAPGAMALLGEVTGVAMPVVGAAPMLGILGSLIGPAITPAGQQPASGGASAAGAATAEGAAKGGEAATAGAVRPVDAKAASAGGAATAGGAAKGGEASTAGAARPVDQRPAGAADAARADGAAKGGEASTAGAAPPVDQRPAGAAGQADAKGAETSAAAGAGPEAGPATAAPQSPETDPNFVAAKGRLHDRARQTAHHPPVGAKVAEAQSAAQGPPNEVASQAGAAQVGKMAGQQPGGFDKAAFMEAVRKAIDAAAPTTLAEADDFKDSGKAGQVKNQVSGLVSQNKESAEKGIKGATQAPPDTSAAQPKPVIPMPAEEAGPLPPAAGAASAMPTPRPAEESNLARGPADVNASMKEADVTEQQLKESNEPEFTGALEAKGEAEKHSAEAPKEFQLQENAILDKGRSSATGVADQGLQAMHGQKVKALSGVASGKTDAKSKDEARRAEVSNKIEGIYSKTKDEVTAVLNGIDGQVDAAFKDGEEKARAGFESYVDVRMTAFKDDRYSGWTGGLKWAKDKLFGMPDEVNEFYVKGRALYLQRMEGVISNVADIVGRELLKATDRIALGKTQITEYVASLPVDLKKVGMEAQQSIQSKFDELTQAVDAKQEDVVNNLAKKYVESRDAVDARIKEMKEANKGLVDKAIGAIKGVIETILKLKDMLLNVLAKAAGVIGTIISAPIKFLGNLVEGIGQGLKQFMSNIGEHLKKGLLGWLFGALGEAGLTLPEKFDLKGILHIIMQILGLTYSHIRGLAVGIVGEEVVTHLEKSLEFFQVLIKEGPAGLWKWIVEKLSELKATVMDKIKEFIQEKVIIAGIMWLIGLLNPVAAFIKACKAIYDIVKFFIERASQVMELVNAILDSVGAIAGGALGEAAGKVEDALGKAIPVAIGFLASLLGLGGISDKIRSIIQAIQEPIHNVISKVLGVVLKPFKWIGNKIKQGAGWAKKKLEQGVTYVKEKAKAGVAYVKGKAASVFGKKATAGQPAEEQKKGRLEAALRKAEALFAVPSASAASISDKLPPIQAEYSLTRLVLVRDGEAAFHVHGELNPRGDTREHTLAISGGAFSLAPGGIQAHERERIQTGPDNDDFKEIHLLSKHVDVRDDDLEGALRTVSKDFDEKKQEKLELHQATIRTLRQDLEEKKSDEWPKSVEGVERRHEQIRKLEDRIRDEQGHMHRIQSINWKDREAVMNFLKREVNYMPTYRKTKFQSQEVLEGVIEKALADKDIQARIDRAFTEKDGKSKAKGTSTTISYGAPERLFPSWIGRGYELDESGKVVPIKGRFSEVKLILVVSDEVKRHFMVETAYLEP